MFSRRLLLGPLRLELEAGVTIASTLALRRN